MKPKGILIVEDEAIVAMDIQARLESLGYNVLGTADSGARAITLASATRPDLVMMDIRLHGPMDGISAAETIHETTRSPIVFLTAHAEEPTLQRAKKAEPFGYILKPFEDRELRTVVEMALYKHQAEEQIRHVNRLYAVLSQINQMIVRVQTVPALMDQACSLAVAHGGFPLVWAGQYRPDNSSLCLRAVEGSNLDLAARIRSLDSIGLGTGFPQANGWRGTLPIAMDPEAFAGGPGPWPGLIRDFHLRALASVPISLGNTVWGMLCFAAQEEGFFGSREIRLVDEIGIDIGYAMDNLERAQENRRIQEALAQREETLRSVTEHMRDMVCLADLDGRYLYLTPSCESTLGYPPGKLLGRSVLETVHPDDRSRAETSFREAIEQRQSRRFELRHRRADGQDRWIESIGNVVTGADGMPTGFVITSRDITDRKEAQEAVRVSEERYRSLVETTCDWIWEVDAQCRYTYASPRVLDLLGRTPEEVIGHSPFEFMPEAEARRVREIFTAVVAQRQPFAGLENTNSRSDGRLVTLESSGVPIFGADGEFKGFRGTDRDISDRKRLEAQLQHAQKMEAVGQLAGGVAHDFNNILAAMMLQLGLLQSTSDLDAATREGLDELEAQANRAASLTRQLLLFGRRSIVEKRLLNLNEVIAHLLRMLGRLLGEHIQIDFRGQEKLPSIEADAGMIEQVLLNMAVNARDAMPAGGILLIETAAVELGTAGASAKNPTARGPFVRLSVTDTGCGMDESTLQHLFEPFFTTKDVGKGTGLGLATAYSIVQQHHGWIEVASSPAKGSTFQIWLPARHGPARTEASPTVPQAVGGGRETLLLVEDETSVRRVVAECLRSFGYHVLEAANANEAMALWHQRSAEVSMLFTDMVMPGGTTGLELAERLRTERPSLKVLLCSGYSAEIEQHDHERLPGVVYLPKPFSNTTLASTVRACLDGPARFIGRDARNTRAQAQDPLSPQN